MSLDIDIRDATLADQPIIAEFNMRLADETEGKKLNPDLIGPGVAAVLNDVDKGRYWLAFVDGEIAGQIMVTYEWSDWRNGRFWWIQSVYVPLAFRRKGIFSALYHFVEALAKEDPSACGLRLYVENENVHAQNTYLKLNMTEPGYRVMESYFAQT